MCIKMYIFKFKKQQTNNKNKRKQASKKSKEYNEEKKRSPENRFAVARVNFLPITRISGTKSIIFFDLSNLSHASRTFERIVFPEMNIFSKITFEPVLIGFWKNQYEQNILLI